jgi:ABC-type antimicrobial peptide transport system permease subunit
MGVGVGLVPEGAEETARVSTSLLRVSPGYFGALGIRFLEGTLPTPPASEGDLGGIVLGRTAALRLFGDTRAVGRRVTVAGGSSQPATVVGVVEDVRLRGREGDPQPIAFGSHEGAWMSSPAFAVRVVGDLDPVVAGVRSVLAEVDPETPADELRTTRQAAADELAARRALAGLAGLFGVAALLLVALGLQGMMAEWVQSRRRELGVRLALGAGSREVVLLTMGRALRFVTLGMAVGVPAAVLVMRLLRSLLFGVSPLDPPVFASVAALVLVVGAASAFAPASRAGRIDPVESLRAD